MIKKIFYASLIFMAASAQTLYAKPAKQGLHNVTMADGSTLLVEMRGDEFYHQYLTEDGYPLTLENGEFYYCDYSESGDLISSGIKATQASERNAMSRKYLAGIDKNTLEARIQRRAARSPRRQNFERSVMSPSLLRANAQNKDEGAPYDLGFGLFPDTRFPAYGDQKALVILVQFQDEKFKLTDPHSYFSRMLNEDGFSDFGGTGCAAEYFRLNSDGAFRPQFDVFGPVTVSKNMAAYGANDYYSGDDVDAAGMVKEACELLDDQIDFSEYDRDGDGLVDNVFVFYAGYGEASNPSMPNTIWPHSYTLYDSGYKTVYLDGVRVNRYGCSNEWENARPDGVGTFIHEFSHVMALPDLYSTSYSASAFTPGKWSALDYGPYNNDGMTPPLYGAFERYALGWTKPYEVDRAISATLPPIVENACGIIRTPKATEFFLLENRQQTGWDKYIPGHGMLIWHIDYNTSIWTFNEVNNTASHQYVDIVEADGSKKESDRNGDTFPGAKNITSFTSSTTPAMKTWSGTKLEYPITKIAETDGVITFDVLGGGDVKIPECNALGAEDVEKESFTARWNRAEGFDHILSVYSKDSEGNKNYVPGYRKRYVGDTDSKSIKNLNADAQYYYTVTPTCGWIDGATSMEIPVTTGKLGINYFAPEVLEATDVNAYDFTARWLPLEGATEYYISVSKREYGEPLQDVCAFDGCKIPEGWSTTATNYYAMSSLSGEKTPSLRLSNDGSISTPEYSDNVKSVSFWHRGNNTPDGAEIEVYATVNGAKQKVKTISVEKGVGGIVTEITDIPRDCTSLTIQASGLGTAYVAIDDIKVAHGITFTSAPLADYTDLKVGDVTQYVVKDLEKNSDYSYNVYASDGTIFSKVSADVTVHTTAGESGIAGVSATDTPKVMVTGRCILTDSDAEMAIYDCSGNIVARGYGRVDISAPGLYIVTIAAERYTTKIIIK